MKVYNSLDFEAVQARVEKNVVDPYAVHAEDYEDINDLVRRAERTKSKLDFKEPNEEQYELVPNDFYEDINLSDDAPDEPSEGLVEAERSEAATSLPDGDKEASQTL